jgi:transposase
MTRSATPWRYRSRRVRRRHHAGGAVARQVEPEAFLADKAYGADAFIETLEERGITPVIPPKANRKQPRETDFALYRERNLVERFFNTLKQYRGIATRYDKLANTFLTGVLLVCVLIWLN